MVKRFISIPPDYTGDLTPEQDQRMVRISEYVAGELAKDIVDPSKYERLWKEKVEHYLDKPLPDERFQTSNNNLHSR